MENSWKMEELTAQEIYRRQETKKLLYLSIKEVLYGKKFRKRV